MGRKTTTRKTARPATPPPAAAPIADPVADRAAAPAGPSLAPAVPSILGRLSQRELDVFQLVAQDFSTREVAENLGISVATVATHLKFIRHKLQVRGPAGMCRLAIREGLFTP